MSSNENSTEKRHFSRIPFEAKIHLVSAEGSWHADLIDVSLKGVLITLPKGWQAKSGEHFLLEFDLGNHDVSIRMEVSVAHTEENHVGLRCEHIDLDSISHLRRLIELNVGDAAILDRELQFLGQGPL
jgi:hypothetical protein